MTSSDLSTTTTTTPASQCVVCSTDELINFYKCVTCSSVMCADCIKHWFIVGENKTCPGCRCTTGYIDTVLGVNVTNGTKLASVSTLPYQVLPPSHSIDLSGMLHPMWACIKLTLTGSSQYSTVSAIKVGQLRAITDRMPTANKVKDLLAKLNQNGSLFIDFKPHATQSSGTITFNAISTDNASNFDANYMCFSNVIFTFKLKIKLELMIHDNASLPIQSFGELKITVKPKSYECKSCQKIYTNKGKHLVKHALTHSDSK